MRRFFIALPVDDKQVLRSLAGVFHPLNNDDPLLRIVPPDNYHITIKFFGSVEPDLTESLINSFLSLSMLKKVEYSIIGMGAFPSEDNPSVIWAGLKYDENPLKEITESVEVLASSMGFPEEKRKFIPHLTIARIKNEKKVPLDLKNFLIKEKSSIFASSVFTELVLYESILNKTGVEYKRIEVINLI